MVYVVGDEDESPAALKQRQQEQARRAQEGKGKAKETDAQDDRYPLYIIVSLEKLFLRLISEVAVVPRLL